VPNSSSYDCLRFVFNILLLHLLYMQIHVTLDILD
jgi:hypothetical protein